MEKLNEYLQKLMSIQGYELHLEPNKPPYTLSATGTHEVTNSELSGTQISTIIFPLIPAGEKQQLPNRPEIEFVLPHELGNFHFLVKKSSSGFNVTIRPFITTEGATEGSVTAIVADTPVPFDVETPVDLSPAPIAQISPEMPEFSNPVFPEISMPSSVEITGMDQELREIYPESVHQSVRAEPEYVEPAITEMAHAEFGYVEPAITETRAFEPAAIDSEIRNFTPGYSPEVQSDLPPSIETVSVYDPEFATSFSTTTNYDPDIRERDFASEYVPPVPASFEEHRPAIESFSAGYSDNVSQTTEIMQDPQPVQPTSPVQQRNSFPIDEVQKVPVFEAVAANPEARARMDELFYKMASAGASDLHLSVGMPPLIRKDGKMCALESDALPNDAETLKRLLTSIMPPNNQAEFERRHDSDFAYEIPELARFRANIFLDRKGMGGVFRIIPSKILTAEDLGLSKAIMDLCNLSKGLVVVTGPTGSGKSTTLCAMVDSINRTREDHIITIEDPIEFTHENQNCLVNQREVHNHTDSFKDALRAALREDPDILLVGEMRDLETISIAIETAETGHLVFGTLHTSTAASTIDRIIDQFPADRQQQIRVMLSESLKGVIAQTLLPKIGGGRVAALEVLIVTPAISNLIREGKTFQIPSAIQTGKKLGMVMLNDALFAHVQSGLVAPRDAYMKAVDKNSFEALLTRNNIKL